MTALKTFGPNELGRDFVIGDLHGSLTCLDNLLKYINFDTIRDRLFSVGDLVDRGEDSMGALRLLYQPWFHTVKSNHEEMMEFAYTGENELLGSSWFHNGGAWGMDRWVEYARYKRGEGIMSDDALELMDLVLEKVKPLPLMITVNHKNGKKFHIIHAELPFAYVKEPITDEHLADEETVRYLCGTAVDRLGIEKCSLWLRDMFGKAASIDPNREAKLERTIRYTMTHEVPYPFTDKLSHIISGHTPLKHPITIGGQTNIDTMAYAAGKKATAGLTAVLLDDWTFYRADLEKCEVIEPLVFDMEIQMWPPQKS